MTTTATTTTITALPAPPGSTTRSNRRQQHFKKLRPPPQPILRSPPHSPKVNNNNNSHGEGGGADVSAGLSPVQLRIQTTANNIINNHQSSTTTTTVGGSMQSSSSNGPRSPSPGRPPIVSPPFLSLNKSWEDDRPITNNNDNSNNAATAAASSSQSSKQQQSSSASNTANNNTSRPRLYIKPRTRHYQQPPPPSAPPTFTSSGGSSVCSDFDVNVRKGGKRRNHNSKSSGGGNSGMNGGGNGNSNGNNFDLGWGFAPSSDRSVLSDSQLLNDHNDNSSVVGGHPTSSNQLADFDAFADFDSVPVDEISTTLSFNDWIPRASSTGMTTMTGTTNNSNNNNGGNNTGRSRHTRVRSLSGGVAGRRRASARGIHQPPLSPNVYNSNLNMSNNHNGGFSNSSQPPLSPKPISITQTHQQQVDTAAPQQARRLVTAAAAAVTASASAAEDDVSSLGGVEDYHSVNTSSPSIQRITLALKLGSGRPSSLTPDEKNLWDAIEAALSSKKKTSVGGGGTGTNHDGSGSVGGGTGRAMSTAAPTDADGSIHSAQSADDSWESRLNEVQCKALAQKQENERSLRAIQRVLADVTAERDQAVEKLRKVEDGPTTSDNATQKSVASAATAGSDHWQSERSLLMRDLETKAHRIAKLEREAVKASKQKEIDQDKEDDEVKELRSQLEEKTTLIEKLEQNLRDKDDAERTRDSGLLATEYDCDDKTRLYREMEIKSSRLAKLERELLEVKDWQHVRTQLQRELESRSTRIVSLERELKVAKVRNASAATTTPTAPTAIEEQDQNDGSLDKDNSLSDLQRELESKNSRIVSLEKHLKVVKLDKQRDLQSAQLAMKQAVDDLQQQISSLQDEKIDMSKEMDMKAKQIAKLKRQVHRTMTGDNINSSSAVSSSINGTAVKDDPFIVATTTKTVAADMEQALRSELTEKSNALENAKKIIASLENASGSLATELRSKLKSRDEELANVRTELANKQKVSDSLATELRDTKRSLDHQVEAAGIERETRQDMISRFEQIWTEVQEAAVVFESTQDSKSIEQVANLLDQCIDALRSSVESLDDYSTGGDAESMSAASESSRQPRRSTDIVRLRKEVDEKTTALKRMEENLRQQKQESTKYRVEAETQQKRQEEELLALYSEIDQLRDKCNANMEVLTRKERELAVLRDSLKVEDDVGYISDDASETEEGDQDDHQQIVSSTSHVSAATTSTKYGPTQAEALATLLSHGTQVGGTAGGINSNDQQQVEALKDELVLSRRENDRSMKLLKTEKESLANAKMIISSLEKANKSMMEDLRSRLQDSNTAIASLLEKSMSSEKTVARLRSELEQLRREKEEDEERHQEELVVLRQGPALFRVPSDIVSSSDMDTCYSVDEKKEEAEVID